MSIRAATLKDIPGILALGKRMHAESPRFSRLAFDGEKVQALFTHALTDHRYFILVADDEDGSLAGGFVGYMAPHWFSQDEVAQDLAVFVRQDRRGGILAARMVKAFTYWAHDRGAKQITLGISTGVKVEQTEQLYKSLGLKQFGSIFEV